MVSHNMAKTVGKSQDISDVKKANNSQHNSGVSHFGKLGHGHGSFYSSFGSVKSEKNSKINFWFENQNFSLPDSFAQTQPQNQKCKPRSHFED